MKTCSRSPHCRSLLLLACNPTATVTVSTTASLLKSISADVTPLHCLLQVGRNDFLYVSANVINHQSLVAAHVRLGVLTARSGSGSKWAAQRDECLANAGSWARRWQCAALMHARCAC